MRIQFLLAAVVIWPLVKPAESWTLRGAVDRIPKHIETAINEVVSIFKKAKAVEVVETDIGRPIYEPTLLLPKSPVVEPTCLDVNVKAYAFVCPLIKAIPAVLSDGIAPTSTGKKTCRVVKVTCRTTINENEKITACPNRFTDYDMNGDGKIGYEEFVYTLMRSVNIVDPGSLRELFDAANKNGDDALDGYEFQKAPYVFTDSA